MAKKPAEAVEYVDPQNPAEGEKLSGVVTIGSASFDAKTVATMRAWTRAAVNIDMLLEWKICAGVELLDVRIQRPRSSAHGTLLVARGLRRRKRVVAFHRGDGVVETILAFLSRHEKETLDWRDDERSETAPAENGESTLGARPQL